MNVQEFIDMFNKIEDKSLELKMVSPYNQMKMINISGISIMKNANGYCFDIETSDTKNLF